MRAALAATPAPAALEGATPEEGMRQLRWATFLVLSRVLTVQSPELGPGGAAKRFVSLTLTLTLTPKPKPKPNPNPYPYPYPYPYP